MKIGILSQWYSPETGAAAVPGILARSLASRGHEVQVVTGFPNYPSGKLASGYQIKRKLDEFDGPGVAVRRVALYPSHDRSTLKRFANYASFSLSSSTNGLKKIRDVDAIWVYNSPATVGLPSALASAFGGPPHLMHVMDLWPDTVLFSGLVGNRTHQNLYRAIESWCEFTYRNASAIACISPGVVDLLADRGVDRDKLHYVPVWTDETIYYERPYDEELGDQLDVSGKFTVLYAGNLGGAQGLHGLLTVCDRLRNLDDFQVLVAGSGTEEENLRHQAEVLSLPNLRFIGQWPAAEMGRLLSISDANLVSLSKNPLADVTMPSKLPGILASGRAVAAWSGGDVARIVDESQAGRTARPGDLDELEAMFREFHESGKNATAEMGRKGRDYYQRRLSLNQGVESIEVLLGEISETRRSGRIPNGRARNGPRP